MRHYFKCSDREDIELCSSVCFMWIDPDIIEILGKKQDKKSQIFLNSLIVSMTLQLPSTSMLNYTLFRISQCHMKATYWFQILQNTTVPQSMSSMRDISAQLLSNSLPQLCHKVISPYTTHKGLSKNTSTII